MFALIFGGKKRSIFKLMNCFLLVFRGGSSSVKKSRYLEGRSSSLTEEPSKRDIHSEECGTSWQSWQ